MVSCDSNVDMNGRIVRQRRLGLLSHETATLSLHLYPQFGNFKRTIIPLIYFILINQDREHIQFDLKEVS